MSGRKRIAVIFPRRSGTGRLKEERYLRERFHRRDVKCIAGRVHAVHVAAAAVAFARGT